MIVVKDKVLEYRYDNKHFFVVYRKNASVPNRVLGIDLYKKYPKGDFREVASFNNYNELSDFVELMLSVSDDVRKDSC